MQPSEADTVVELWAQRLSERPLPVWRASREALLRQADGEVYTAGTLIRSLAHDAALCAQLLRQGNAQRPGAVIATLEQAAIMLGAAELGRWAETLPTLEDSLPDSQSLADLRRLDRQAFHVGYLARELARLYADMHYDDAFYAGQLLSLGERSLRAGAPAAAAAVAQRAQACNTSFAHAAHRELELDLAALSAALIRRWQLPALMRAAVAPQQRADGRAELVRLASALAGVEPLWSGRADARLQRAAVLANQPVALVKATVFRAAAEAASWLSGRMPPERFDVVDLFPCAEGDVLRHSRTWRRPRDIPQ